MGRSVGTARNAVAIAYATFEVGPDDYDIASELWGEYLDDLRTTLSTHWPTMTHQDTWHDREGRIIAMNGHALVVVYEYCGVVSINLVPREDVYASGFAEGWCDRVADRFRITFGTMKKIATFSNGEAVYMKTGS